MCALRMDVLCVWVLSIYFGYFCWVRFWISYLISSSIEFVMNETYYDSATCRTMHTIRALICTWIFLDVTISEQKIDWQNKKNGPSNERNIDNVVFFSSMIFISIPTTSRNMDTMNQAFLFDFFHFFSSVDFINFYRFFSFYVLLIKCASKFISDFVYFASRSIKIKMNMN